MSTNRKTTNARRAAEERWGPEPEGLPAMGEVPDEPEEPEGLLPQDAQALRTEVDKRAQARLIDRLAEQRRDELLADIEATERREALPAWGRRDMVAWLRKKPKHETITGNDTTGVVMRPGQTARLLAEYKSGKTTDGLDWLRCSLTGEPWLGYFPMVPIPDDQKVVYIDTELGEDAHGYLRTAFGPELIDRVIHVDLLGSGFIWASAADRRHLIEQCAGGGRIFVDSPLQMFTGNPNDLAEVNAFMLQQEDMKRAMGATELMFSMFMNRSQDARSFGSIAWDAKAHALLAKFVDKGQHFLRGDPGRAGTGFPDGQVVLREDGRPEFIPGVTRASAGRERQVDELTAYAREVLPSLPWDSEPVNSGEVGLSLGWDPKRPSSTAWKEAENRGELHRVNGPKGAKHVHPGTENGCRVCAVPTRVRRTRTTSPLPPS